MRPPERGSCYPCALQPTPPPSRPCPYSQANHTPQRPPPCIPPPCQQPASSPAPPADSFNSARSDHSLPRSHAKGHVLERAKDAQSREGAVPIRCTEPAWGLPLPQSPCNRTSTCSRYGAPASPLRGGFARKAPHPPPPPAAHRRRPALTFGGGPPRSAVPPSAELLQGARPAGQLPLRTPGWPPYLLRHPLLCVRVLGWEVLHPKARPILTLTPWGGR